MIKRYNTVIMAGLLITGIAAGSAMSAVKKVKKQASTTHHETVGTTQLKGEYGLLGHTYTLGKQWPWNICLKSAEYTIDPVYFGDYTLVPHEGEKFLLLHFTVHNPNKTLALMRWDQFWVTAIDPNDKNLEAERRLGSEETHQVIAQQFKPAQKMDVYRVVVIPASGEIPKLMLIKESR